MIEKANIAELANLGLEGTDKFVVENQVRPGNVITVVIDGDTPVNIVDCIKLSKFIEAKLDRDEEDFELRVTSFGADKPFKLKRQYRKNIGREIKIVMDDDTSFVGELQDANDEQVMIKVKGDKKKGGNAEEIKINFDDIKEASIVLSFK